MYSASGKLSVLVVDDSEINRTVLAEIVGSLGGTVTLAEDGAKAVKAAERTAFDLVLMDIAMPTMDGIQATRQLRRNGVVCPIVAVTAHARRSALDSLSQLGFDDLIEKPVTAPPIAKALDLARANHLG